MNLIIRVFSLQNLSQNSAQQAWITRMSNWSRSLLFVGGGLLLGFCVASYCLVDQSLVLAWGALCAFLLLAWLLRSIYHAQLFLHQKIQRSQAEHIDRCEESLARFNAIVIEEDWHLALEELQRSGRALRKAVRQKHFTQIENHLQTTELATLELQTNAKALRQLATAAPTLTEEEDQLVDLNYVLHQVLINLQVLIDEKQAEVYTFSLPIVLGKESDFVLIFQQLLQYGLRNNESLIPCMNIVVESTEQFHYIGFRANGKAQLEREQSFFLFDKTWRRKLTQARGDLGLSICKKLVAQYQGEMTIHSEKGKAATFCLKLPCLAKVF